MTDRHVADRTFDTFSKPQIRNPLLQHTRNCLIWKNCLFMIYNTIPISDLCRTYFQFLFQREQKLSIEKVALILNLSYELLF